MGNKIGLWERTEVGKNTTQNPHTSYPQDIYSQAEKKRYILCLF